MTLRRGTVISLSIALPLLTIVGLLTMPSAAREHRQSPARELLTLAGPTSSGSQLASPCLDSIIRPKRGPEGADVADAPLSSSPQSSDPPPRGKGFVPPPMDLSHLTTEGDPRLYAAESLPSSFDWRDREGANYVTSVKDQGQCGSCYAFAALGNIESRLLLDGTGTYDLSENHAKECNWYDTSCAGGNYRTVVNLLSKWGTVLENCDPYVASDVTCTAGCAYQQTVLDWRIISGDRVPSPETLKHYVYTYGPIYVSMYAGHDDSWGTEFGSYDGSYILHYAGTDEPNHAVLIVGWDDDLEHDEGSGGWIVKNSWGPGWGDDGYFRIAYGSASIGKWASFVRDWEPYDDHGVLWYYDEGGMNNAWGYGDTTAWGLAKFTPDHDASAVRVELWTTDATTDIDVYLYDDFDGTTLTGLLGQSVNHAFDEAGYHSIPLDAPVALTASDEVAAVVKLTNATYAYPVAADIHGRSEIEKTYLSHFGTGWIDLGASYGDDAGIRLRTSTIYTPVRAGFTAAPLSGPIPLTTTFTNTSTGNYTTTLWTFGDGTTSTVEHPTHVYVEAQAYTVTLTITGLGGTETLTRSRYITAYQPVEADFVATPLSGTNPLTVTFMNRSTGSYDAARWDFGDGFTSTVQNPSHTYAAAGTFTVTLTVSGTGGVDTITRPAYISVALFGDLDGDCDVDIDDIMLVAGRWNTESGDLDYDDSYDIDSDGDIDVKDVMLIAAEWGNTCSGAAMMNPTRAGDVSQGGADVHFVPSTVTSQQGEPVTMDVVVADGANLGGFEFSLRFDPDAIRVTDVRLDAFLAGSGNNVVALGPRDGGSGRLIFGGFSYGEGEGASGKGTLATLALVLLSESETVLRMEDVQLVASDASRISVGTLGEGRVRTGGVIYLPVVLRSH